jgi:hypothetical protein
MTAYYNEIDPQAAQWLRNLIAAGRIAPGDVDERSVWDVHPDDLDRTPMPLLRRNRGLEPRPAARRLAR